VTHEVDTAKEVKITVRRKRFDVIEKRGYIDLEIGGKLHRFRIYANRHGRGYIVEYNGFLDRLSNLRRLLKGTELEIHREVIEKYIRSLIYEAQIKEQKKHRVYILEKIETEAGILNVGIRDDGKIVLKLGNKRVIADNDSVTAKLKELIPFDAMSAELVDKIKGVFKKLERKIVSSEDVIILTDNEAKDVILPSMVINNKLVTMIPFIATYIDADMDNEPRRGLLILIIITNDKGNIVKVDRVRNPIMLEVDGKSIYKDFLERMTLNEAIARILPNVDLINRLYEEIKKGSSASWTEADELVEKLLSKYVYIKGRDRILAKLYAIAQVFYDLIPLFPMLRDIGEMGSGKRQLANVIAACTAISITVVQPTEAALYRLVDAFHPLVVIDESKIDDDISMLLNAGFEKDKFVPRARIVEEGKITIDIFNFYSPKIIVSRPGRLNLPEDTISRTIEIYMQRVANKVYPLEIDPKDREEAVTTLLLLKIRRWKEFIDAYDMLREELVGIDPRTRDTYLPLITVAYLIARERNDPSLFVEVVEDMIKTAEERAGVTHYQRLAIVGILKHVVSNSTLNGMVKLVSISTKDIASALGMKLDGSTRIRIGKFLREAPFKVSISKSGGYTKYLIDLEKLYQYVLSYGVDISMLTDEELEKLEKVTGLSWKGVSFNKDDWIKSIVEKLFGGTKQGHPLTILYTPYTTTAKC